MSGAEIATDRFWSEFKPDVAGTLSVEQRGEIDRVLDRSFTPGNTDLSDLRLSFKWFFVRLAWGPERRNPERIKAQQEAHPVMARCNAPMLAGLFAGYMVFAYLLAALFAALVIFFVI